MSHTDVGKGWFDAVGIEGQDGYAVSDNRDPELRCEGYSFSHIFDNEYYLEIPDVGFINGGNVSFSIDSNGIPEGSGNLTVQLVKENLNLTIGQELLYQGLLEFDNSSLFSHSKFFDLSTLNDQGLITHLTGKYILNMRVYSTNINDTFYLSEFQIQTDTYVTGKVGDTHAWITNPATNDTDGDGWLDNYEILTSGTNPTEADSDQDGVNDPDDRDPHGDVIIGVAPYYCEIGIAFIFQIISYASYTGSEEIGIKSSQLEGNGYVYFDDQFYFNVDDDNDFTSISFDIEAWIIDPLGNIDLLFYSGTDSYAIGNIGNHELLSVISGNFLTQINVSTHVIERVNTIAIYDPNETSFVGHYQEKERMNVIQVHVNDEVSCDGTPFIEGPNAITIPTSIFTETVLNGYIETGRINETALYSEVEGEYDIYSVDRSGKPIEEGSGDGDFVFIRFNLNATEAMEILNMLLICVINNTTNETAICYEHYSTKLNGTKASMMNLPVATMAAIGWDCRYESSEEGPDPTPSGGWDPQTWLFIFGILFLGIISFGTVILVVAIALIVTESADAIAEAIQKAMMAVISFLAHLVWLAIRAALLVFAYIMLAIELLFISTMVLGMGVPMLVISLFIDMEVTFGLNWAVPYGIDTCAGYVQFDTEESTFRTESWIVWYYWAFFDIYIPWVEKRTISNDHMIMNNTYSIIGTESHEAYSEPPREALEEEVSPQLFGNNFTYVETDLYNFTVNYDDLNLEGPDEAYGVKIHLIEPDGTAQQGITMAPVDSTPDYTEKGGVTYTYELDTSTYDDGIWHYFFSTKDKQTGKTIIFPNESYFMGPDTYSISYYLISPHVNISIDAYHESDGWADEDWSFQIHWWDMAEENSPQDVTLCLIPSQKSLDYGMPTHTRGIQKFSMSLADTTPNWSNPVEYRATINFNTLNYLDDELGTFYYYFEATRQDGKVTKSAQYEGPYVRSINEAKIRLDITSSDVSGDIAIQNVLESDSEMIFSLEYSDPSTIPQTEMPKLNLTSDTQSYEFDFECYEISPDERTGWYVLHLNSTDFKAGTYGVSIETPDGWNTDVVPNVMGLIHNLNFGGGVLGQMSSSFLFQGIIPLGVLAGAGAFALMEDLAKFKIMAIVSLTALIVSEVATVIALLNSDDNGGLLGFSLANLIIQLIMVATISKDLSGILNGLAYLTYFSSILSTILILSANTAGLFGMDILEDILYVSDNILNVLILGVPVAIACITINIILGLCLAKKGSKCAESFKKLIYSFMGIYLVFSIVGFIAFGLSFN